MAPASVWTLRKKKSIELSIRIWNINAQHIAAVQYFLEIYKHTITSRKKNEILWGHTRNDPDGRSILFLFLYFFFFLNLWEELFKYEIQECHRWLVFVNFDLIWLEILHPILIIFHPIIIDYISYWIHSNFNLPYWFVAGQTVKFGADAELLGMIETFGQHLWLRL